MLRHAHYSYTYDAYPVGVGTPGGGMASPNLAGRLATVTEPNGQVVLAYDDFGRPRATGRIIAGKTVTEILGLGMSGQVQSVVYAHDLTISLDYDRAGRPVSMTGPDGVLWQADAYDGAGRLIEETFGNGVQQVTDRDILGLPERVQVERPLMAGPLYDVAVTRNAWTGLLTATDSDGVGLNHSATFAYDGAARLTASSIGTGTEMYSFAYRYDGLQNMTLRTQTGPAALDMVAGDYLYAGGGAGPRQLTSVNDDQGSPVANFTYDDAGRMTEDTGKILTYNGLDQLIQVDLPGEMIPLLYSYGYNGQRTYTQHADGTEEFNFTESIRQDDDLRHHYLKIGSRTVARVTMRDLDAGGAVVPPASPRRVGWRWMLLLSALALASLLVASWRRRALPTRAGPAWALVPLLFIFTTNLSCSLFLGSSGKASWTTEQTIYFHQGFSAGPTMMTDEAGNVFEERRYEPFGVDIDTYSGVAGGTGGTLGIDFSDEPTNILNKTSDEDTKWSYHGARWVSPQTARWHSPDPIVKAPDAKFMVEPWALHPYQYVSQNPVIFWDPDGQEKKPSFLGADNTEARTKLENYSRALDNGRTFQFENWNAAAEYLASAPKFSLGHECLMSMRIAHGRLMGNPIAPERGIKAAAFSEINSELLPSVNHVMAEAAKRGLVESTIKIHFADKKGRRITHSYFGLVGMPGFAKGSDGLRKGAWERLMNDLDGDIGHSIYMVSIRGGTHSMMLFVDTTTPSPTVALADQKGFKGTFTKPEQFDQEILSRGSGVNDPSVLFTRIRSTPTTTEQGSDEEFSDR